jgi:hypothetical protein
MHDADRLIKVAFAGFIGLVIGGLFVPLDVPVSGIRYEPLSSQLLLRVVDECARGGVRPESVRPQWLLYVVQMVGAAVLLAGAVAQLSRGRPKVTQAQPTSRVPAAAVIVGASLLLVLVVGALLAWGEFRATDAASRRSAVAQPEESVRGSEPDAPHPQAEMTRTPPIRFEHVEGEWVTSYEGARKLVLTGVMVNVLDEPLNYTCKSTLIVHIVGKRETYEAESEYGTTGCSDPGALGIGKSKNFGNWDYDQPAIPALVLEYRIARVEWRFEAWAETPLGARYRWVAATGTLPHPSERRKFMLEPGAAGQTAGQGSKAARDQEADDAVNEQRGAR